MSMVTSGAWLRCGRRSGRGGTVPGGRRAARPESFGLGGLVGDPYAVAVGEFAAEIAGDRQRGQADGGERELPAVHRVAVGVARVPPEEADDVGGGDRQVQA